MIRSSVTFAVPKDILLKKDLQEAVTFSNFLDSSKNFRPCNQCSRST